MEEEESKKDSSLVFAKNLIRPRAPLRGIVSNRGYRERNQLIERSTLEGIVVGTCFQTIGQMPTEIPQTRTNEMRQPFRRLRPHMRKGLKRGSQRQKYRWIHGRS
jgi:hypothetical protein